MFRCLGTIFEDLMHWQASSRVNRGVVSEVCRLRGTSRSHGTVRQIRVVVLGRAEGKRVFPAEVVDVSARRERLLVLSWWKAKFDSFVKHLWGGKSLQRLSGLGILIILCICSELTMAEIGVGTLPARINRLSKLLEHCRRW